MDVRKCLELLDSLYTKGDLEQAENYIDQWITEALEVRNYPAALTFFNEMEGLLRTTGRAEDAADIGEQALDLISLMGLDRTVHHATTLQNCATANRVAGHLDKALDMYIRAVEIYRYIGHTDSYQMASLYHNMSHIYQEKGQHSTALVFLDNTLDIITKQEDCEAETATTFVCMALSHMAMNDLEKAQSCLDKAMEYYDTDEGRQDGHYGSALSALGEFYWCSNELSKAVENFEKALEFTYNRFGDNQGCEVIKSNIETIKAEMNS